jgi:predicted outer membrane repeat protein
MHVRGRAAMLALVAVLLAGFVAVAPASAATVGARWQARMGPGGANGTATATIDTSGAGTISVNLKRLARAATYTETLFRGTCAARSTRIATLPSLRTSAGGTVARANSLTAAQATLLNGGSAVIRLVSGSQVYCGALARQAGSAIVTTCDQAHVAAAIAAGGTVRFACDATIRLTTTLAVSKAVVLDGTDRAVAIDGDGKVGLFSVRGGATFGLVNLALRNGRSNGAGGAIDATHGGAVSIVRSTLAGNHAGSGGAVAAGRAAAVTVVASTFVGNVAAGRGGAIDASTVSSTNSTFSANQAENGGAIHAATGLTIVSSTFSDNVASGAAIALDGGAAAVRSSILADVTGTECVLGSSKLTDQGGNFSTDGSCGLTQATSRTGVPIASLALAPLADNGGPTQTVALLTGSPAIHAGVGCPTPATDQRGVPRPPGAACDSGAFQVEPPPGYDISFPQCGDLFPVTPAFGIVGVNGGRAFTPNPCLGAGAQPSELAWAGGVAAQLYANTGNPGPALSAHWPSGQATPRPCDTAAAPGADTASCAYDYGWNAAADSYQVTIQAYVSLGLASPGVTRTPSPNRWWLDVETDNSWRSDVSLNVAALQGEVAYLRSVGVLKIGFYSTPYQWQQITGGTTVFSASPSWLAGARTSIHARDACAAGGFTGGRVTLAQFAAGGFDADLRC